jgi:two-component system chemotaxis response regulator CheY
VRILLVDDQATMRTLLRSGLRRIGLTQVCDAADGREALGWLAQDQFDLVISDLDMPGMDGLSLLKAVRMDPKTIHTPFILTCGVARSLEVAEARELGVNGVIAKPFSIAQLAKRIEPILVSLAAPAPVQATARG